MPEKKNSQKETLPDVLEAIEIFVPEFAARVAAIEHVLVSRKVCSFEDLRKARDFVDVKKGIEAVRQSESPGRRRRRGRR